MNAAKPKLLHILLVIAFPLFLYLPSINYDFAYDDILHITYNETVTSSDTSPAAFASILKIPTPPGNLYRPIPTISYKLNYILKGLNPGPFHLLNILLYCAVCVLVLELAFAITGQSYLSLFGALLFAIHPIHVEAVANVIGRAELLVGLFGLLALRSARKAAFANSRFAAGRSYLAMMFFYLLSVLSKESAFTFLILIPFGMHVIERRNGVAAELTRLRILLTTVLLGNVSAIGLALRHLALPGKLFYESDMRTVYVENPIFHLTFAERLVPALKVLGDYIALIFAPLGLSADYSMIPETLLRHVYSPAGMLSLLLVFNFAALAYLTRHRAWSYFGFWFFISFALTANIFTPIGTIMGDRLAFTPSIGAILFFCCLVGHADSPLRISDGIRRILIPLTIALFLALTIVRLPVWRNNETLFTKTLEDAPESPKSLYNYAVYLMTEQRDYASAGSYLRMVLGWVPNHVQSMKVLADIALAQRDYARVEYWCRKVLQENPNDAQVKEQLEKLLHFKEQLKSLN